MFNIKSITQFKGTNLILLLSILLAFSLNFFGEISNGIFEIGFTDELAILGIYFVGFLFLFAHRKIIVYQPTFVILFTVLSLVYMLFYYTTFFAFFYEYYKLFVFMAFIPFLRGLNYENLKRVLLVVRKYFLFVLSLNFVFIILQIITNNQVLAWIGYSELRVSGWEKVGRYTGLFDVGTLGATALIMLLINELAVKKDKIYYILTILCVLSILFSSSKTSYLIFLVWIIIYFKSYFFKHFLKIVIGIFSFLTIVLLYTYDAIFSKFKQYAYFFEMLDTPHLINLGVVEMRAMFWAQAVKIFSNNPFGLGFGTFGDASSKYNPDAYMMSSRLWPDRYVVLSDSSLAHLLAEQGIFAFVYLTLVAIPLLKSKRMNIYAYMLLSFYLIQIPFTMGFSAGTWPLLFAFAYAIIYYENKYKGFER